MTTTYHGSCHCGAVAFEADVDLAEGTGGCNCSICMKTRNWTAIVAPERFRLMQGAWHLAEYRFGSESGSHNFCHTCGVHLFCLGYLEEIGGDFVAIRVNCLDDVPWWDLAEAPVRSADGRHDNWWQEPKFTAIL